MSALPKQDNQAFWMESRAAEIPFPQVPLTVATPSIAVPPKRTDRTPDTREQILFPDLTSALKFERAISIAIIVFGLMILSTISYHSLMAKFDQKDARMSIRQTQAEIGRYREEIETIQGELGMLANSEGFMTIPIEPGDVAIVTLPSGDR